MFVDFRRRCSALKERANKNQGRQSYCILPHERAFAPFAGRVSGFPVSASPLRPGGSAGGLETALRA
jgi:hypothetical protein